jgi:hypothetical protein
MSREIDLKGALSFLDRFHFMTISLTE